MVNQLSIIIIIIASGFIMSTILLSAAIIIMLPTADTITAVTAVTITAVTITAVTAVTAVTRVIAMILVAFVYHLSVAIASQAIVSVILEYGLLVIYLKLFATNLLTFRLVWVCHSLLSQYFIHC